MRAFIAIELPKEIKDALSTLQEELKSSGADVKWVAPDNIHLTLKFLGEIDDKKADEVSKIIEEAAKNNVSFIIRLASVGVFPKINYPRVIWAGIDTGGRESEKLAAGLQEQLAAIGIPREERPFSSHITIGRVRSLQNKDKLIEGLNNLTGYFEAKKPQFPVNKITLFKSTLTPKGPLYEIQKEASLKAA
ncbi:MAG: RNA 2',3'-cyclic phosphodiesterase [Candidatus Omnitrophica bacterium]|nr:RNA 2',3'-cyclic phosphodiesterase [Candidatus Omnitrophota bacterium]